MFKQFIKLSVVLFFVHSTYAMQYVSKMPVRQTRFVASQSMQNIVRDAYCIRKLSMQNAHKKEVSGNGKFRLIKNPKIAFGLGVVVGAGATAGVVLYVVADTIMVVTKLKKQQ